MGLFFNEKRNSEIFKSSTDKIKESNQIVYRENFLQTVFNEQQQLNKQLTENASKQAEKHEKYSQQLLEQLSTQDTFLLEMYRKIQANEETSNSIQEQLKLQAEIKDLLVKHDDLQNIYHLTLMEKIDNQNTQFMERIDQQDTHVVNGFEKHGHHLIEQINQFGNQFNSDLYKIHTQIIGELNNQDLQASERFKLLTALLQDHIDQQTNHANVHGNKIDSVWEQLIHQDNQQISEFIKLNSKLTENIQNNIKTIIEHIDKKDNKLNDFVANLDTSLSQQLEEQNQHFKELVDQQDVQNEQLERKLDFIKSTIFERAADLSEKLDGHFKKITEFFGGLFTKPERNRSISLKEEKEKEEKIKM